MPSEHPLDPLIIFNPCVFCGARSLERDLTNVMCIDRSDVNDDSVREALVKRMLVIQNTLPETLKVYCELALMHVEHENLKRKYANEETMLLEPIANIAREDFYVTEDNYAWDMSELVQAITANGGVMRNPLSKQMFTPKDVRGIMMSTHGKPLVALQVAQKEMSQGVRPETIARMDKLADVMLAEKERDSMQSRKALDEFQAYVATCKSSVKLTASCYKTDSYST